MFKYQYNDILDGAGVYPAGTTISIQLAATISRKNIDDPVFPSTGFEYLLDAEFSGSVLLPGNLNYYKISFLTEWYKRLFNTNRLTWYTATEMDYIHELDQFTSTI